jgi:hypothetical protein
MNLHVYDPPPPTFLAKLQTPVRLMHFTSRILRANRILGKSERV